MRNFKKIINYVIYLLLIGLFFEQSAWAKLNICSQKYALCSASQCVPDPIRKDNSICPCDVYNGQSIGNTSCKVRKPSLDGNGVLHIVSTFSFKNKAMPTMKCPASSVWSNCLDAPCSVNPENTDKAICLCKLVRNNTMVTFGGNCATTSCKTGFLSGALINQDKSLRTMLAKELNIDASKIVHSCEKVNQ